MSFYTESKKSKIENIEEMLVEEDENEKREIKAKKIKSSAIQFQKEAKELKKSKIRENNKIFVIGGILVFLFIIFFFIL